MDNIIDVTQAILALTPVRWQGFVQRVPDDLLKRQPAAGEWSALDCLVHLLDTERWVFPVRVQAFLGGRDFPGFDPDAQGTKSDVAMTAEATWAEFERLRSNSLAELKKVTQADLTRTARHSQLGVVSLSEMLHEWAAHDLMHTVQAERALMQPMIQECGPWKVYFADHIAK